VDRCSQLVIDLSMVTQGFELLDLLDLFSESLEISVLGQRGWGESMKTRPGVAHCDSAQRSSAGMCQIVT
jgi:hypothetical protein